MAAADHAILRLLVGDVVAQRYRILRHIASGGMGAVFEAAHLETGRHVALKIIREGRLLPDEESSWLERFRREARVIGALRTPHVVEVLDAGTDPTTGQHFIAMELLTGRDLASWLKELGPLPPLCAVKIVAQACRAVKRAHAAGVIHRDIKPSNLFLAESPEGEITVKLVDFGIAKVMTDELVLATGELTQTGSLLGTPSYMSPEQARGRREIDSRSDLWSLAVVLYKAVSNRVPHWREERPAHMIVAICNEPTPPIQGEAPWLPPEIARVLTRALARDISQRFQSADEMSDVLLALLPDGPHLTREMMRPLTELERSVTAELVSSPSVPTGVAPASRDDVGTEPGLVRTPSPRPTGWLRAGVLGTITILLAAGGYAAFRVTRVPAVAADTTPAPTAEPDARVAKVKVEPSDAEVTVNGQNVPVLGGSFEIRGRLGSMHEVWLRSGDRRVKHDIVIADKGASPESVSLPAPAASDVRTPTVHPVVRPATRSSKTSSNPTPSSGAPPKKGGVPIVDEFDK
jgi:serine/threonine-protein kinase